MSTYIPESHRTIANAIAFKVQELIELHKTGVPSPYCFNPSKSQSSPFDSSDRVGKWHPFDALLAERRAILAGERAALEAAEKKDAAWWREVGRG